MEYIDNDLKLLHCELYDILSQVVGVCNKLNIKYFVIGGTAIGAHFDNAILPWDDDIDIGMEREDYERFLREAPAVLAEEYIIQSPENEPNTPYYFTKVRKDHTLFVTKEELEVNIHHGIYIDIFPFDRVSNCRAMEVIQHNMSRILRNAFVYNQIGLEGSDFSLLFYQCVTMILPKRFIYKMLRATQTMFNGSNTRYISIINTTCDHIERSTVNPPQIVKFGDLEVAAPNDLLTYLNHHYNGVRRDIPVEEQVNHAPMVLSFNSRPIK